MAFMDRCTARAHADCLLRQILESPASDEDLQVCRHCEATLDDLDVVAEEVGQRLRALFGDEFTHETGLRDAAERIQNLLVDGDSGEDYPSGDTVGHPSGAAANAVARRIQIGRLFGSAGTNSAESQPPSRHHLALKLAAAAFALLLMAISALTTAMYVTANAARERAERSEREAQQALTRARSAEAQAIGQRERAMAWRKSADEITDLLGEVLQPARASLLFELGGPERGPHSRLERIREISAKHP